MPAYAVFSAIATAIAAAYLVLCLIGLLMTRVVRRFRPPRAASCRPGEIIHQALKITGRRAEQYRTAALLFAVSLLILIAFGRLDWWPQSDTWVFALIAALASALQLFGVAVLIQLARYRMRLSRLLDTYSSMSRRLAEAQLRGNRVYHSVRVGDAVVDNVVAGPNGVYAIGMVPPPLPACESVALVSGELVFQPGNVRVSLQAYRRSVRTLAKTIGEGVGSKVIALPVIVVPGCIIDPSSETLPMVVSLESCMSFVGLKEPRAFLMDDEVDAISRWLDRQSLEAPRDSMREMSAYLDRSIARPALV